MPRDVVEQPDEESTQASKPPKRPGHKSQNPEKDPLYWIIGKWVEIPCAALTAVLAALVEFGILPQARPVLNVALVVCGCMFLWFVLFLVAGSVLSSVDAYARNPKRTIAYISTTLLFTAAVLFYLYSGARAENTRLKESREEIVEQIEYAIDRLEEGSTFELEEATYFNFEMLLEEVSRASEALNYAQKLLE